MSLKKKGLIRHDIWISSYNTEMAVAPQINFNNGVTVMNLNEVNWYYF